MSIVNVKGQAEFDAALKRGDVPNVIDGHIEVSAKVDFYAYDSATVRAYGSATVTAYGSATVRASDSATVTASGSVFVRLFRALSVKASVGVIIAKHATSNAKIEGGQVIACETFKTPAEWCVYYGVDVVDGIATVYKSLNADFTSPHGTRYAPGDSPEAPDWDGGKAECGGGLHFSPSPMMAEGFHTGAKWMACQVRLDEMAVHPDGEYRQKCKAKRALSCVEVDIHARPIPVPNVAS